MKLLHIRHATLITLQNCLVTFVTKPKVWWPLLPKVKKLFSLLRSHKPHITNCIISFQFDFLQNFSSIFNYAIVHMIDFSWFCSVLNVPACCNIFFVRFWGLSMIDLITRALSEGSFCARLRTFPTILAVFTRSAGDFPEVGESWGHCLQACLSALYFVVHDLPQSAQECLKLPCCVARCLSRLNLVEKDDKCDLLTFPFDFLWKTLSPIF